MSNHNDHDIEAASQEAERLLAELESLTTASSRQAPRPSPTPPPAPPPPPYSAPQQSPQQSPQAHTSRKNQTGLVWLLVAALASFAGILGVASSFSARRSSFSTPTNQQPSNSEPPLAGELSAPKVHTEPYTPKRSHEATSQALPSGEALTEEQALSIIKGWLMSKRKVFAPPFISQAADSYVANGPLWKDITKQGGSIDWLKTNNSHYSYAASTINNTIDFTGDASKPSIIVSVTQDMAFHDSKGIKRTNATDSYRYTFRQERGSWKIWDYKKQ